MSELYEKSLVKLELDRILQMLADCAGSQAGKDDCLALRPASDLEDVEALLAQTTAAVNLSTQKGNPGFSEVHDVSDSLERADRGGTLQPKELLHIASVLRCARNIKGYVSDGTNELKTSNFIINDPGGTERKTLADFLKNYPYIKRLVY